VCAYITYSCIKLKIHSINDTIYFQSSIECFYDEPGGIVYLHLTGTFDSYSITQNIDELSTEIEEKVRKNIISNFICTIYLINNNILHI